MIKIISRDKFCKQQVEIAFLQSVSAAGKICIFAALKIKTT